LKARYIKQIMINWNIKSKSEILPLSVTPLMRREDVIGGVLEEDAGQPLEPEEWPKELIEAILRLSRVAGDMALAHELYS